MTGKNCQKIKLVKILEMLRQESDENNPLKTIELCQRLNDMGIQCDKKTLSKDIATLNEYGYDVQYKQIGHEKGYFIQNAVFSVAELKILIDAVQAAGFVTDEKTQALVEKVASLGGSSKRSILDDNIVLFNITKHTNEDIYENVATLETALKERKKASFKYFDRNEHQEKIYRKEGNRYIVEPMALIFNDDNYYLMSYSAKYDGITNYRVDRMEAVEVEDEPVSKKAIVEDADIAEYRKQVFKMYGGPVTEVAVEFDDKLIGVVQDKFGEHVKIIRIGTDKCIASLNVQVSPTFWGWIFQFGKQMRIVSPEPLAEEYKKLAQEISCL